MKLASLLLFSLLIAGIPVRISAQDLFAHRKIAVADLDSPDCRAQSLEAALAAVERTRSEIDRENEDIRKRRLKALQEMGKLRGSYRDHMKARAEFENAVSPKLAKLELALKQLLKDQSDLKRRFLELGKSIANAQDVALLTYRPNREYWDPAIDVTPGLCVAIDDFVRNGRKLVYQFNVPDAKIAYFDTVRLLGPSTTASRLSRAWNAATQRGASNDAKAALVSERAAVESEMRRFVEGKGWTYVFTVASSFNDNVASNRGRDLTNDFVSYYNQRYP